jgi:hypothetical protein
MFLSENGLKKSKMILAIKKTYIIKYLESKQ